MHGTALEQPWRDRKRYGWLLGVVLVGLPFYGWLIVQATGSALGWWFTPLFVYGFLPLLDTLLGTDPSNPPEQAVPALVQDRYYHRVVTLVFLWAAMGLAWNIISGYAGQISFGHQAFFGIGAYVTVLLVVKAGLTPWLGMVAAMAAAVLAAVLIGIPTFRLAGIYFGLATLAYPLIFRIVMDWLGYQEVSIPMQRERPGWFMQFTEPRSFDLLALGVLAATLALSRVIETSRLGYRLRAIRENEQAAEAMGVDSFRCKMAAYMLSAAPAAVVGAVYIHAILFIVTPEAVFGLLVVSQTLVVALVGGTGTLWGPLIGAALMVPVSEILDATVGDRLPGISRRGRSDGAASHDDRRPEADLLHGDAIVPEDHSREGR